MISTASGEAPLKGLYAAFSVRIPKTVQTITETKIARGTFPNAIIVVKIAYAPTMIISPCAKFNIFAIPYTIV